MYLSCLLINVGDNPDRPRPGRLWLRNLYHVHQRLCMAFPSSERKSDDPHFLKPFNPVDFGGGRASVTRNADDGFLYRIDPHPGGRVVIVVQSALKPKWEYAFQNADYLLRDFLAAPPEPQKFDPCYANGQQLRFRIRAALTTKKKTSTGGIDLRKYSERKDRDDRQKSQSKRVALTWDKNQNPQDAIREWFAKKGEAREKCPSCTPKGEPDKKCPGSFEVNDFRASQIGWGNGYRSNGAKNNSADRLKFRSALLEGTLTVTNTDCFRKKILHGIGSGKAFGFGLLSVAPCQTPIAAEEP